jgi:integrase
MPWLLSAFRDRAADSITPGDLEHHVTRIAEERDWAPASINRYRALISLIFPLGIENGKAKENPARLVKPRHINNARIRWLSPEEESRLRAAVESQHPEHLPELELALNTGLRLGEMYGLTWETVNLSRRVLTIPASKNGEMRHVPINSVASVALLELRKRGEGTGRGHPQPRRAPLSDPRHWFDSSSAWPRFQISRGIASDTRLPVTCVAGVDLRTVQERYSHLAPAHALAASERLTQGKPEGSTDTKTSTSARNQVQVELAYVQ